MTAPDGVTSEIPRNGAGRKTPATVITGFLGAGKTTLIRHLLKNADGRRIALIVNEFGDVGVDGDLIRDVAADCGMADCAGSEVDGGVVELTNGCLCCTVADDFEPALTQLLDRAEPPDHIIIETSGLALPQPLVRAFGWPAIRTRVVMDGVTAVVDAAALSEGRFTSDEDALDRQREADEALDHETPLAELFDDQLSAADMVVLNKVDLVGEPGLAAATDAVTRRVRPGVGVVRSARGAVDPAVLLGLETALRDGRRAHDHADDQQHADEHAHEHAADDHHHHDHHHNHHDHDHDAFATRVLDAGEAADVEVLVARLGDALRAHGVLRLKGFAAIAGKPMRLVVQAAGPRIETYFDRPWPAKAPRRTRLVVIGEARLDWDAVMASIAEAVDGAA